MSLTRLPSLVTRAVAREGAMPKQKEPTWYERYGERHPTVNASLTPEEKRELDVIASETGIAASKVAASWLRLGLRRYRRAKGAGKLRNKGLRRIIDSSVKLRTEAKRAA